MKIFIVVMAVSFLGCSAINVSDQIPLSGMTVYEAWEWIPQNIKYKSDFIDELQLPETTYKLRTGDCDDFAILLMSVMNEQGPAPELVCASIDGYWHYVVLWNGRYYEAQQLGKYHHYRDIEKNILWKYSYDYTIRLAR